MPFTPESKLDLSGYPVWVRDLVHDTTESGQAVVNHEIWTWFSRATIAREVQHDLVVSLWSLFSNFHSFILCCC